MVAPQSPPLPEKIVDRLRAALGEDLRAEEEDRSGIPRVTVSSSAYRTAAETLHKAGLDRLEFVTCIDDHSHFTLTLQAYAFGNPETTLRIAAQVPRDGWEAPTVSDLWHLADWEEREVYDQFGLVFSGHPDLRRILNPDAWVGHPLRKDYADPAVIERPNYI